MIEILVADGETIFNTKAASASTAAEGGAIRAAKTQDKTLMSRNVSCLAFPQSC